MQDYTIHSVRLWDRFRRTFDNKHVEVRGIWPRALDDPAKVCLGPANPASKESNFIINFIEFIKEYRPDQTHVPGTLTGKVRINDLVRCNIDNKLYVVDSITTTTVRISSNSLPSKSIDVPTDKFNSEYTFHGSHGDLRDRLIKTLSTAAIDAKIEYYTVNQLSIIYKIGELTKSIVVNHDTLDLLRYESCIDEIERLYTAQSILKDPKSHTFHTGDIVYFGDSPVKYVGSYEGKIYFEDGTVIANVEILKGFKVETKDYPYDFI